MTPGAAAASIEATPGARSPLAAVAASVRALPLVDLLILAYALGLLVLWSPALYSGLATPRTALIAVALGPGLVVLAGLVRRRDGAATWAVAYLAWALLAALASGAPRIAIVGSYGSELGWVYLAGYLASWGLGRHLGPRGRRALPVVILVGLAANVAFAALEALLEPDGLLSTDGGRVLGLTGNCLYLGGLAAGGVALGAVVALRAGRRWPFGLLAVAGCTLAANLSGSRSALVGGAALAALAAAIDHLQARRRPTPEEPPADGPARLVRAGAIVAALVVGLLASLPMQSGGSSTGRIETASGGVSSRVEMWKAGVDAVGERPVVGWGPGRFRAATGSRTTLAFVRAEGPDRLFFDAHDLPVEHAVTTGVPGLALLVAFAWAAGRRARGPSAWFAAGVAVTWLLTPMSVSTGPIALLALGAAWRSRSTAAEAPPAPRPVAIGPVRVARTVGLVAGLLGVGVAGILVYSDVVLEHATSEGDAAAVRRVERLRPPDAVLADLEASAEIVDARFDPSAANKAIALRAARRAPALDPTRSTWWVNLGYAEGRYGTGSDAQRVDRAEAAFAEALRQSPWSTTALLGMEQVATERGDDAAAAHWRSLRCQVVGCTPP